VSVVASGYVTDRPFARTVYWIAAKRFSGDLVLSQDGQECRITWQTGAVIGAQSPSPADTDGRVALTAGLVTSTQLGDVLRRHAATPGRSQLELLAELARLSPDQVVSIQRRAFAQRALRVFALDDASFVLDDAPSMTRDPNLPSLSVRWLIHQGVRGHYTEERLASELAAVRGMSFRLSAASRSFLNEFGFGLPARRWLGSLSGQPDDPGQSMNEIATACSELPRKEVMAMVYALLATDALEAVGAAPTRTGPLPHLRTGPIATPGSGPIRSNTVPIPRVNSAAGATPSGPAQAASTQPAAGPPARPATPARGAPTARPATPAPSAPSAPSAPTARPATPARGAPTARPATPARGAPTARPATPARGAPTARPATPTPARPAQAVPQPVAASRSAPVPAAQASAGQAAMYRAAVPRPITDPPSGPGSPSSPSAGDGAVPAITPRLAAARAVKVARTRRRTTLQPVSPDEIRRLIAVKISALDAGADHFQLIGVARNASDEAIRNAYFELAGKLHPDRLRAANITDLEDECQRVFAEINVAFGVLASAQKRAQYLAELESGGAGGKRQQEAESMASRVMAAEEHFRRGEWALRRNGFAEALTQFEKALELNPGEAEHHALLGWTIWCAAEDKESVSQQVMAKLQRALEMVPKCLPALYYRGRVEAMLGKEESALRCFRRVAEIDPSYQDARLQVRLLESRREQRDDKSPAGLLRRLKESGRILGSDPKKPPRKP
jgi:DnaJ-domain-containing protein 1